MKTTKLAFRILIITAVVTMQVHAQPTITIQPQSQAVPVGGTITLSVNASGTGPFSYQWQFNGTNLPSNQHPGIITTVAGNGLYAYSGDGGPATNASLRYPSFVVEDAIGNQFIGDTDNDRIRKVDTNGIITTVAGNGNAGYSGDGGPATNASFNGIYGLALR
jgi:hypothetical protein